MPARRSGAGRTGGGARTPGTRPLRVRWISETRMTLTTASTGTIVPRRRRTYGSTAPPRSGGVDGGGRGRSGAAKPPRDRLGAAEGAEQVAASQPGEVGVAPA